MKCIYSHCSEHEKRKTCPLIRTADEVREEMNTRLDKTLQQLYSENDNLQLAPGQILQKRLVSLQENILDDVDKFFKKKQEDLHDKLKGMGD